MTERISGIIVVLNEQERLRYALGSLTPWCDEVIVVDQGSDDGTPDLARSMGATIVTTERMGSADPGRPIGVDAASGDWIMIIDADETVHPRLGRHLRELVDGGTAPDVLMVPRLNIELGHWMRYGSSWPSRKARFFRKGQVAFKDRLHAGLRPVKGARVEDVAAEPEMAIWHFSYPDVTKLVDTINRYTTIEAEQATQRGEAPVKRRRDLLRAGGPYLWRQYIRGGGRRDGMAGMIVGMTRVYYRFLVAAKRWDTPRRAGRAAETARIRQQLLDAYEGGELPQPPQD